MKDVPDIAPEVRGLLEEIVADPRSSMRLVPRKALRSWFDTDEVARASEITTTRAERHLIEEHRESLAALLCEAAMIAYWKAPVLNHRPVSPNGQLYEPAEQEPEWKIRAGRFTSHDSESRDDIKLLRECMMGLRAGSAHALALASLSLAPSDRTRCYAGLTIPWDRPRSAIRFFRSLSERASPKALRPLAILCLSWRLCSTGQISEALEHYQRHSLQAPESIYGRAYALNLSCHLGDRKTAQGEADELARVVKARDPRVVDLSAVVAEWARSRSSSERSMSRATYLGIAGPGGEVARALGGIS